VLHQQELAVTTQAVVVVLHTAEVRELAVQVVEETALTIVLLMLLPIPVVVVVDATDLTVLQVQAVQV
jgi:hypothetical protein